MSVDTYDQPRDYRALEQPIVSPASERVGSLDMLRGVAILGILLMNIPEFALSYSVEDYPPARGWTETDQAVWFAMRIGVEGTIRGLLMLLFGASVIMITRAMKLGPSSEMADIYYRRTIGLVLIGAAHAYLLYWPGDILLTYGLAGLFLFPWRKVRASRLIIAGLLGLAVLGAWGGMSAYGEAQENAICTALEARSDQDQSLSEDEEELLETCEESIADQKPSEEELAEEEIIWHSSYVAIFTYIADVMDEVYAWQELVEGVLEAISFMLIGMGLFKLGVLMGERRLVFYLGMAALGYGIGLPVNIIAARIEFANDFASGLVFPDATIYIGQLAVTLGHLGLLLALWRIAPSRAILRIFTAPGRMALSVYIAQTVICLFLFTGIGLALHAWFDRLHLLYIVLAISVLLTGWAWAWLHWFRFGPLEWAWRSFTYGRLQQLRR
jgi:uncharacterized protein